MRYQGRISHWRDDKGFGFVTPNGGGQQAFVHIKAFSNRQRRPVGNELVTYELASDAQGRLQAVHIMFVGERSPAPEPAAHNNTPPWPATVFLACLAGLALAGKLPLAVPGFYLAASAVAFIAYASDKSAARNDRWRTPENTLHLFALLGGWPGALLAQRLLRHKTQKTSFQFTFWSTVALNCGALGWLFSSLGPAAFRSILRIT